MEIYGNGVYLKYSPGSAAHRVAPGQDEKTTLIQIFPRRLSHIWKKTKHACESMRVNEWYHFHSIPYRITPSLNRGLRVKPPSPVRSNTSFRHRGLTASRTHVDLRRGADSNAKSAARDKSWGYASRAFLANQVGRPNASNCRWPSCNWAFAAAGSSLIPQMMRGIFSHPGGHRKKGATYPHWFKTKTGQTHPSTLNMHCDKTQLTGTCDLAICISNM